MLRNVKQRGREKEKEMGGGGGGGGIYTCRRRGERKRDSKVPLMASTCLSISSLSTRPLSPVPLTSLRLTPHSLATLLTAGVANTFPTEEADVSSSLLPSDEEDESVCDST